MAAHGRFPEGAGMADATRLRALVGYDGSLAAGAAIEAAARLLPDVRAAIAHLWTPPFASQHLRHRIWSEVRNAEDFSAAIEREGLREAERVARTGVLLARASGWDAEPLVARCFGDEGVRLTELAREGGHDLLVLGSRGLGGAKALLGSASDSALHGATHPVLVVPYPLFTDDVEALPGGPVLLGWDGSAGATRALEVALRLWPQRQVVLATVDRDAGPPPPPPAGSPVELLRVAARDLGATSGVAGALATAAREHRAAVLVVGSRGRSAVREVVLGSVAMGTVHRAHRPVVVVPGASGPQRNG
jgi:nucleotide-binding universal stress UspA family protein